MVGWTLVFACNALLAASPWSVVEQGAPLTGERILDVPEDRCAVVQFDRKAFHRLVEGTGPWKIDVPLPGGSLDTFTIERTPLMHPSLAAKFPGITTYAGVNAEGDQLRLDVNPKGARMQILGERTVYLDPLLKEDPGVCAVYFRRDARRKTDWQCFVPAHDPRLQLRQQQAQLNPGGVLRTYRIAVAATGEYTLFHGGTKADAMAAIVTTMNRVTGIYTRELSISFQLVPNNDLVVFTDPATDGYSNSNANALLDENQVKMDTVIGTANYDIGHVFSTDGGGLAQPNSVCVEGEKAMGETGDSFPQGDSYDVDFVAHEIGHQFGADHTFNGVSSSCGGNRSATSAFEPGSGSTIMGYAGICASDNIQPLSDDYFHSISLEQIYTFITTGDGAGCSGNTSVPNAAPVVDAGSGYIIPVNTPFSLTATGSDSDGDVITYCWEERDLGPAKSLTGPDNGSSPLMRSRPPTVDPTRTFPRLEDLLAGNMLAEEQLPTMGRTMNFRVTARDNRPDGGAYSSDDTVIVVDGSSGPFRLTQPNSMVFWSGAEEVSWDPAGSADAPINATQVNILLSLDGGTNFPITLVANTPNDGSQEVMLPNISASQARIRVEAAGNIFFDVSDADFVISPFDLLAVTPQTDQVLAGPSGFVSSLPCFTYTAVNNGAAPITFATGAEASWISGSPTSDSLPGMTMTNIEFCINASADALLPGTYTSRFFIANQITAYTNAWNVFLTVEPAGGIVAFEEGSYILREDDGALTANLLRTGNTNLAATVTVSAVSESATSGMDYAFSSTSVMWAVGESGLKSIAIPVVDDLLPELNETFRLVVSSSDPQVVRGVNSNVVVTIQDDDTGSGNDMCSGAIAISQFPFSNTQSTSLLTDTGDPLPSCGANSANGGWYQFTPTTTGTMVIDTEGSNFNTILGVYHGVCGSLTELACDNDSGNGLASRLEVRVFVGEPIYLLAGGFNGASGSLTLSVDLNPTTNECFDVLVDGMFEASAPNVDWTIQTSTQFGSVICDASCSPDPAYAGPNSGEAWAWFGTSDGNPEMATVGQAVVIPHGEATLRFQLWIATVGAPFTDQFNVEIDGQVVASYPEPSVADTGYILREVDVSAFADGGLHEILFTYNGPGGGDSDYNVDDVVLEVCISDLDGDGLPNDWEKVNGLNAGDPLDAQLDSDTDFMSNLQEYLAGTLPLDGDNFLQLLIDPLPVLSLRFNSVTGRTYSIDGAMNPSNPAWKNVVTNLPGTGNEISVTNAVPMDAEVFRLWATKP